MLVQFYKHENEAKVFADRNSSALIVIKNTTRSGAQITLGFRAKSADWHKTSWGSEIELTIAPKKANPKRA